MITDKQIEELKARYTLFTIRRWGDLVCVATKTLGIYLSKIDDAEKFLTLEHLKMQAQADWMIRYPGLYFSIGDDLNPTSAWVNRNGRDGTSIGLTWKELEPRLNEINQEALKALQPGYFYCTNDHRTHPMSEYGYYWFASTYCKACEEADPAWSRSAHSQSYN
jgi:hypothetical protein